jgi:hypothetical protein
VRRTVPPSAEIEEQIDRLLAVGVGENPRESLSELARLGARLIIQRAVEDEFEAWLGRARYERRPDYQRGLRNYEQSDSTSRIESPRTKAPTTIASSGRVRSSFVECGNSADTNGSAASRTCGISTSSSPSTVCTRRGR